MDSLRASDGATKNGKNLAAHWSAARRKTAIFGWLAPVAVAVFVGNMAGQKTIHAFSGEAGRAEHSPENAAHGPTASMS